MNKPLIPLHVYSRSVYGKSIIYMDTSTPERAEMAEHVKALTGCKTLLPHHLSALEGLGYELVQGIDPKSKI